jgi:hypothetical protein
VASVRPAPLTAFRPLLHKDHLPSKKSSPGVSHNYHPFGTM